MNEMSPAQLNQLFDLLGALRDGIITSDEFSELNTMLEQYPAAREYYLDYVGLYTDLSNLYTSTQSFSNISLSENTVTQPGFHDPLHPSVTMDMLRFFAEYEKNAEALEIPKHKEAKQLKDKDIIKAVPPHKMSKFTLTTLITSIAAVLVLMAYVVFNPQNEFEVATVTDTVNAQWSHHHLLEPGIRLVASASDPIQLHEGVIELESDKGVNVTLEGPAEFHFISPDQIVMNYGRLFAVVPQSGAGFTVQTQNSKIIDLGTRFGVYASTRGETELHVFKGRTTLIAGLEGQDKKTFDLAGGEAGRVNSYNGNFSKIALNNDIFVQGIDSDAGVLITGGRRIDLADIIGGGDGSGNGASNKGLMWDGTGIVSTMDYLPETDAFPSSYVPVPGNPLMDGIFVPYGKSEEPLVLTSKNATLNLDDFIASDTNGLLTLVLLREVSDENSAYWFCSKEAAKGEPDKYPTLIFPNASEQSPVQVTTAHKNGADAYVSNDHLRSPKQTLGQWHMLSCRYFEGERVKIVFLRFDISDIKGDLTDAVLNLYMNFGNRPRDLKVYGLADGPADLWNEKTINYNNAPGLLTTELGKYALDSDRLIPLGTFAVVDNRIATVPIHIDSTKRCLWTPPSTRRRSVGIISNAREYIDKKGKRQSLMLDGVPCGTRTNPSILMHANAGITFDLDAIRLKYGSMSIESFTAACGISQLTPSKDPDQATVYSSASFYILVDGQEVFSAIDASAVDSPQEVDIQLTPQARFLTLVTTQGADNSIANDVCVFVNPTLKLK